MTQVETEVLTGTTHHGMWFLVNPDTGANDIVLTYDSSTGSKFARSASYTGVTQTDPLDVSTTNTNPSATSLITTLITTVDNCWTMLGGHSSAGGTAAGTNSTKRTDDCYDSNADITPAGSFSMTYTASSGIMSSIMAAFKPFTITETVITIVSGSFTLTGIAVAFARAWNLIITSGSFVLTGIAVALSMGFGIIIEKGTFVLTGINVAFVKALTLALAVGTFTLTGVAVAFKLAFKMAIETGNFILTGIAVIFRSTAWIRRTKPSTSWTDRTKPSAPTWKKRTD